MSELKNILSEYARALKADSEVITCDDGDTGAFIPKGSVDSTLSEFYFRIDKGEIVDPLTLLDEHLDLAIEKTDYK